MNGKCLILELVHRHLLPFFCPTVENPELILRGFFFSWHLVFVGFQLRSGLFQNIDDPQILHFPAVFANQGKFFRIVRPTDICPFAFFLLLPDLFFIVIFCRDVTSAEGIIPHTVCGHLVFDDSAVLVVLFGLQIVFLVHPPEVEITCEENALPVGGYIGPFGILLIFFPVFYLGEITGFQVVFQMEHLLLYLVLIIVCCRSGAPSHLRILGWGGDAIFF